MKELHLLACFKAQAVNVNSALTVTYKRTDVFRTLQKPRYVEALALSEMLALA